MAGLMGLFQGLQGLQGHPLQPKFELIHELQGLQGLPPSSRHLVAGARVVAGEKSTNPQVCWCSRSLLFYIRPLLPLIRSILTLLHTPGHEPSAAALVAFVAANAVTAPGRGPGGASVHFQ
jgi:hypothetical protein